jgi:formylglycine-generating enzyme required for sulfatase activity
MAPTVEWVEAKAPNPPPAAPTVVTCPVGMVTVPAGQFYMGFDAPDSAAYPPHAVRLSAYCIDRNEVTVEQYLACSQTGKCPRPSMTVRLSGATVQARRKLDALCNAREPDGHGDHPMNCIDHSSAASFCASTGKRLPTESEWEYAARGPDGRVYPWGDESPSSDRMNGCGAECVRWGRATGVGVALLFKGDDHFVTTSPVGIFDKGQAVTGVRDMAGNVWEWVSDFYDRYEGRPSTNPEGPKVGTLGVIRGGAWNTSSEGWAASTFRYPAAQSVRSHAIGFRCAKALPSL